MADSLDVLVADLVSLGRSVPASAPDERLAAAVVSRVSGTSRPRPARSRRRLTVAVSVVVAVLLGALAAPPVRATLADWFDFAAVRVHLDDDAPDSGAGGAPVGPPAAAGGRSLSQAAGQVDFVPVVPTKLGRPDGVGVSADGRVLSLSWDTPGGVVRLDQLDGRLDYRLAKTARDVQFTDVAGDFALWFDRPHEVVTLDADGTQLRESARLAGNTLIWEDAGVTLRLEGDLSLAEARAIAATARPVGSGRTGNR